MYPSWGTPHPRVALLTAALLTAAVLSAALARHGRWLLVLGAALAVAWLACRGACTAAVAYGNALEVAFNLHRFDLHRFDLHRFDLHRALHLPLPATGAEEAAQNRALTGFLLQDLPADNTRPAFSR